MNVQSCWKISRPVPQGSHFNWMTNISTSTKINAINGMVTPTSDTVVIVRSIQEFRFSAATTPNTAPTGKLHSTDNPPRMRLLIQ